jgi:glycosyltransferase involved in cell wall biosynthesis
MKFSVLLPTRNRLTYLRYAVDSVLRQDYDDWEIVISDNDSDDDIAGYVAELGDPRVRYARTERFLPVTDNWNAALARSTGDYVVMLGDDDALAPGYFSALRPLIEAHGGPEVVYTGAYLYAYPGVMPDQPRGFLQPYGYAEFLRGADAPFLLPKADAARMVNEFANFRVAYGFNMQFVLVSRAMIRTLEARGPFYQSPFPDYYAMNALFLSAPRILACPWKMVVIGVTPKSYGFYHVNKREAEGVEFLQGGADDARADRLARVLLPGSNLNTSWLVSLETLRARFAAERPPRPNYARYRMLQIAYVYEHRYVTGQASAADIAALRAALTPAERAVCDVIAVIVSAAERVTRRRVRHRASALVRRWLRQTPSWDAPPLVGAYAHVGEVLDALERLPSAPAAA